MAKSDEVKASTQKLIAEQAQAMREISCRPENYYGLFVFFSGFYNLYLKEVEEEKKAGEVVSVIPQVHGIDEDSIYLQLENKDYLKVRELLSDVRDISVIVKTLMSYGEEEWNCVSVRGQNTTLMTFCGTDKNQKKRLSQKPGEISLTFTNKTNKAFRISGKDKIKWLSGEYPVPPVEYQIP